MAKTVVMAPGKGLERCGSFPKASALRNLKTLGEFVCMSKQQIHNP